MVDFKREVHCLLGLPVDAVGMQQALQRLEQARQSGERCFLSTPNLNFLVASQTAPAFRDSVCRSDLCVADGMPLVWIARLLGIPLHERVSGSGLFEQLRAAEGRRWRVFFFGGGQGAAQEAVLALGRDGGMRPVGLLYPGFGDVERMSDPELIDCINDSRPDFLVVSLGAAKGQDWISRNLEQLKVPVVSHLGAVVNFVAGTVRRAPPWMQRTGLEWLWRIKEEPALWRRYWGDGLALLRLLLLRVLPLALLQRSRKAPPWELERASVSWPHGPLQARLCLHGAWCADKLGPLREACAQAFALGADVELDLGDTTGGDSAFCGLLLLLDQALRDRASRLLLSGGAAGLRRVLRFHGLPSHLLDARRQLAPVAAVDPGRC